MRVPTVALVTLALLLAMTGDDAEGRHLALRLELTVALAQDRKHDRSPKARQRRERRRQDRRQNDDFESKHPRGPGGLWATKSDDGDGTTFQPQGGRGANIVRKAAAKSLMALPPKPFTVLDETPADGGAAAANGDILQINPDIADPDRYTIFHELGHVFAEQLLTYADRAALALAMGIPNAPWWGRSKDYDNQRPIGGERFAEAYALAATGTDPGSTFTDYAYSPSAKRHRRVVRLINQIAARHGLRAPYTRRKTQRRRTR